MCFIDVVLGLFSTTMFPMLRAMMSRQCTPDEQGMVSMNQGKLYS